MSSEEFYLGLLCIMVILILSPIAAWYLEKIIEAFTESIDEKDK